MKKGPIIVIILILVVVGYLILGKADAPSDVITPEEVNETEVMEDASEPSVEGDSTTDNVEEIIEPVTEATGYTLEEIAMHATPQDCWFAVSGKVYDVSAYIAGGLHPGEEAILQGCGKDATQLYTQEPEESGIEKSHEHSDTAKGYLENYYIGDLN